MPLFTILFGAALMAIGIVAYVVSEPSSADSLLPSILGLVALTLGVGSVVKKELRMHLMHGAVIIAAMGVLVPVVRMAVYLTEMEHNEQVRMVRVLLTVLASGVYVYLAVQSFRAARRARKETPSKEDDAPTIASEPAASSDADPNDPPATS